MTLPSAKRVTEVISLRFANEQTRVLTVNNLPSNIWFSKSPSVTAVPVTATSFQVTNLRKQPRCRLDTSHQRCSITSSISCTMILRHFTIAALSPNHGFHAPESTFSLKSASIPLKISNPGGRHSQIHPIPLLAIPAPCRSNTRRTPPWQTL